MFVWSTRTRSSNNNELDYLSQISNTCWLTCSIPTKTYFLHGDSVWSLDVILIAFQLFHPIREGPSISRKEYIAQLIKHLVCLLGEFYIGGIRQMFINSFNLILCLSFLYYIIQVEFPKIIFQMFIRIHFVTYMLLYCTLYIYSSIWQCKN